MKLKLFFTICVILIGLARCYYGQYKAALFYFMLGYIGIYLEDIVAILWPDDPAKQVNDEPSSNYH